jgi:hypothetical protein
VARIISSQGWITIASLVKLRKPMEDPDKNPSEIVEFLICMGFCSYGTKTRLPPAWFAHFDA